MISRYIVELEEKMNRILGAIGSPETAALYWEQWLSAKHCSPHLFKRVNYYYYYICLGLFLTTPVAIAVFGLVTVGWEVQVATFMEWLLLIVVYVTFLLFIVQYVGKILD